MPTSRTAWRAALGLALAASSGCTAIRNAFIYTCDRVNDGADMLDLGLTVSRRPCLSAYACGLGLFTAGWGKVDGWFTGIGGSRVSILRRHYHYTIGLVLWSYEEFGWGDFDKNDPNTLNWRYVGAIGWLLFPKNRQFHGPA